MTMEWTKSPPPFHRLTTSSVLRRRMRETFQQMNPRISYGLKEVKTVCLCEGVGGKLTVDGVFGKRRFKRDRSKSTADYPHREAFFLSAYRPIRSPRALNSVAKRNRNNNVYAIPLTFAVTCGKIHIMRSQTLSERFFDASKELPETLL